MSPNGVCGKVLNEILLVVNTTDAGLNKCVAFKTSKVQFIKR